MTIHQIPPAVSSLFLSCVTKEFRPYRDALAKDLNLPHVKVQVQEDFIEGGHSLLEKLDDYIKTCVAVINLVGSATGSTPKPAEVAVLLKKLPDFTQKLPALMECLTVLSYTQWEVWLAIYHEVPCYVYRAESSIIPAPGFVENSDERKLQEEHWNRIQQYGKDRKSFPSEFDLRILVLRSLNRILPRGEIKSHVIPKGLRSFDETDAAFFLDLLPGLHDENNLPLSIRFWKHRIEVRHVSTFSVGVIYGPSGCGKSSLVKAGLLPRLAQHVICIHIEATADGTESRLLTGVRNRLPELSSDLNLTNSLNEISRGAGHSPETKVVLVIDQFEQWLHGRRISQMTELAEALQRSDGEHLQTLLIVRDDFWTDLSRFMGELNVRLIQDQNTLFVDLFDQIHAENVLAAFGRGYGRLSEQLTLEQKEFVKQAVEELSEEGRVISVRLALFAEMVKGKPWTPNTLKEIGGIEGVGSAFLNEKFSSSKADPQYRLHEQSVRNVLKALLPETGTDIKGNMKSYADLHVASEYARNPTKFDELLRILDMELHLITPTNKENQDGLPIDDGAVVAESRYFQLTHDYLVPSLRDWLTRKLKETRQGRAELLLADRAVVWNARPENRQLPSLLQWFQIKWLTSKQKWTSPQNKMMRKAGQVHLMRGVAVGMVLAVAAFTGLEIRFQTLEERNRAAERQKQTHAEGLVQAVLKAETAQIPAIIAQMDEYRRWTDPQLRDDFDKAATNSPQKLHAALALLPVDSGHVEYLYGRLLDAKPNEVLVICDALFPHKDGLLNKLWKEIESPDKGTESHRLQAAAALAKYDPDREKWVNFSTLVVNDLVLVNPIFLGQWAEALRPVKNRLLLRLSDIFGGHEPERTTERSLATNILADYAADNPELLANLIMNADEKQFATIFPRFADRGEQALAFLASEIDLNLSSQPDDEGKETLAKRQANAAVALLKLDQPEKVWPLLQFAPKVNTDPRVRSYLIHRLAPLGVDPNMIIKRQSEELDISIRRALLLSLGEFGEAKLPSETRTALLPQLQEMYRTETDPGLHAAAEWLLRQLNEDRFKEDPWCQQLNAEWAADKSLREKRLGEIRQLLATEREQTPPQWYVNSQGQTMVVIPGPVEFMMGSPDSEFGYQEYEPQHRKRVRQTFSIATKSVTVEQYRSFDKNYDLPKVYTRIVDLPVVGTSWYQAVSYCNWLSEQEGLIPCYDIKGEADVTMRANYLSLSGYRLPTEAEMEYATRAGASTSRYFGETEDLLTRYAWYQKNSEAKTWPVGSLKPNDFGLFDVHGNVLNWCQESFPRNRRVNDTTDDIEDDLVVNSSRNRVLRGGSYGSRSSDVRSAFRLPFAPTARNSIFGFRLARTLPPVPLTALTTTPEGGEIENEKADK